ncbi:MAG: oxidoreductase [Devosia sp.]|uniref:Gfo/Idh/MocA family oxidoreductase n=1 Tax=Devosia sp. TaxID=1871048 RepID=UPI002615DAF3|nr:Gfo/Idh/MocA family oxidoreductase [Devosia sp.]MDB5526946.1 oxidoreductase [Devosia sp.]
MTVSPASAPSHVVVIGGGRWARVIATVLLELLPAHVPITIQTVRGRAGMLEWAQRQGLSGRISVVTERPAPADRMAVIVANAAADHAEAARWALAHRLPVLVEKPVTTRADDTAALMALAQANDTLLCAGHVFLFAGYFREFVERLQTGGSVTALHLRWSDAATETRHGEAKSYDASVSIHADWLPHILSMLGTVLAGTTAITGLAVARGGASEALALRFDNVPATIELERNACERVRRLEVMTERGPFVLDFSSEPGTTIAPDGSRSIPAQWSSADRPLATMLRAFLAAAAGGPQDARLAVAIGYQANLVIDSMSGLYQQAVLPWTAEKLRVSGDLNDADLRYRLAEQLQADGRLDPAELDAEMARFIGQNSGESASRAWLRRRLEEI